MAESFGGPSRAVCLMERGLIAAGVQVETATTLRPAEAGDLLPVQGGADATVTVQRHYFPVNIGFYRVSWRFLAWIGAAVRRYDVIHVHGLFNFPSVAAAWAARHAGTPYVIRPFGVLARYGMEQRRPRLKRLSLRLVERRLLVDAAAVHFTSERERDESLSLGVPLRPVVIPLAVERAAAGDARRLQRRLSLRAGAFRFAFLSRLSPTKNLESVIGALGLLRLQGCEPELLVGGAGETQYISALRTLARQRGVANQIHWLGHVSGSDKSDLLALADAFVLASWSESFGMAVAEALAAGVPCIVSDRVALAPLIQSSGAGLVVGTDVHSVATGLRTCMERELRARAAIAARSLAESRFSAADMARRLVDLYGGIAGSRDSGPSA